MMLKKFSLLYRKKSLHNKNPTKNRTIDTQNNAQIANPNQKYVKMGRYFFKF